MKVFRNFVIVSIGLVILYILINRSTVYQKVFAKIIEWISSGITAITTGGIK